MSSGSIVLAYSTPLLLYVILKYILEFTYTSFTFFNRDSTNILHTYAFRTAIIIFKAMLKHNGSFSRDS